MKEYISLLYHLNYKESVELDSDSEPNFWDKSLQLLYDRESVLYRTVDESNDMTPGEEIAHFYLDAIKGEHVFEAVLGSLYYEGKRVKQDYKEAFNWSLKAAEYGIGLDESQYLVGRMYELGQGVKRDNKKAIEWYLKASSQDNILAMARLSELFLKEK